MNALTCALVCSVLLILASFLPPAESQKLQSVDAEIVHKRFSSGFFPVIGGYVEYEVKLINTGDVALENQSLWVSLSQEGNRTYSHATYSILLLEPGESKTFYFGPFKIEEEGRYLLQGRISDLALNFQSGSFVVYGPELILAILFVTLTMAGSGIAAFSIYRKKKSRHV